MCFFQANRVDPDQTAPRAAVWSRSALLLRPICPMPGIFMANITKIILLFLVPVLNNPKDLDPSIYTMLAIEIVLEGKKTLSYNQRNREYSLVALIVSI